MNALITGASRGIGLAIAERLSETCNITINSSKNLQELQDAGAKIERKQGKKVLTMLADVSDYKSCTNLFEAAEKEFGSVDILINNAGISYMGLFSDMKREQWKKILEVNLESVINMSSLAVPSMIRKKYGKIVNISSIWGDAGASCEVIYSASKGAVNSFTKSLAKELAPSGINVNAIACGVINTSMNNCFSSDEMFELTERIPAGRLGSPQEIAALCRFLVSDEASYLNGQVITVDGGFL